MGTRGLRGLAVATFAVVLTACSSSSGGGAGAGNTKSSGGLMDVKLALQPVADFGALWLGDQEGIFAKHGFKLSFPSVATAGPASVAQLLNGQIDVAAGSICNVIAAVAKSVPIRALGPFSVDYDKNGQTLHSLIVSAGSSIHSAKDLEGKTVGVNTLKDSWESEVRETIDKAGGDASKVKLVQIPFADQVSALKQGRVNAIDILQPFASQLLSTPDYRSLGDPMTVALGVPDGSSGAIFAAKSFLDKHPTFVSQWRAAMQEASTYANAHPDEARKVIAAKTGLPLATVNKSPLPQYSGTPDPATIATWSKLLVKFDIIKSAPSVDDITAS
jgi:NitT/TauT family transport system substrate-binding protein